MGKKNKEGKSKDKPFRATAFDYMKGGRIEKMGERYGVDKSDYNVNFGRDNGRYKGGREEYEKAIQDAAMRDYDTRRTMEAQALAGKKKARKYAEEGFGNIEDVIKANNMRERWHKKAGNGGSFSSASDFAGQTMRSVEREREVHDRAIDQRISEAAERNGGSGEADVPEYQIDNPIGQRGGRENNTSAVYDDYQDAYKLAGISDNIYSTGGEGQASTEESVGSGPMGAVDQLKEFQEKVKTGMALAGVQTRGPQAGVIPGDGF